MYVTRRAFVAAGSAATAALAGCLGGSGGDGTTDEETTTDNDTLSTHPGAADLDTQPTLGPPPEEATGAIVAFEDPSCPRCKTFEREIVPKIRAELVEPGDVSLVFRGFPFIFEWGEPATHALEATYARNPAAHWTLASHYFENQDAFKSAGPDEVLPRTREVLAAETDVDAEAVVAAVENGETDAAVGTDGDAGRNANVTATPTVLLFRDGEYRTRASGSVGFDVIESALGF